MEAVEMSKAQRGSGQRLYYIYVIECKGSNRRYVGRTRQPLLRKRLHINPLRKGNHSNEQMQNDFNLYGEDSFSFKVIDTCKEEIKVGAAKEKEWMERYKSYDINFGYNYKDPKFHPRKNHTKHKAGLENAMKVAEVLGIPVQDLVKKESE